MVYHVPPVTTKTSNSTVQTEIKTEINKPQREWRHTNRRYGAGQRLGVDRERYGPYTGCLQNDTRGTVGVLYQLPNDPVPAAQVQVSAEVTWSHIEVTGRQRSVRWPIHRISRGQMVRSSLQNS